jgi:Uma2 family endonuclease
MSIESPTSFSSPLVLHMGPVLSRLSDEEFYEFCRLNPELRIEQTRDGDLVIMPPTGGNTGRRNLSLAVRLWNWTEADGTGVAFDSSTAFKLPDGATRSPDASWIRRERWEALTEAERDRFSPICPDFVLELRSPSDTPAMLREKMLEYIECGARLGILIDPYTRLVEVYRPGAEPVVLEGPPAVSADPEMPGLVFQLDGLWA